MNFQLADLMLLLSGLGLLSMGMRGLLSRRQMATLGGAPSNAPRPWLTSLLRTQARGARPDETSGAELLQTAPIPEPTVQQLATEISSLREIVQGLAKELKTIRESLDSPRTSRG